MKLIGSLGVLDNDKLDNAINDFKRRIDTAGPIPGEIITWREQTALANPDQISHTVTDIYIQDHDNKRHLIVKLDIPDDPANPLMAVIETFGEECIKPIYRAYYDEKSEICIITVDVSIDSEGRYSNG